LEVKNAWCSSEKISRLLGCSTKTSLAEGIRETVEWARTKGAQQFQYLSHLEIGEQKAPKVWSNKKI
jgi:dTDP-D-glucose 4,6-dehydratase